MFRKLLLVSLIGMAEGRMLMLNSNNWKKEVVESPHSVFSTCTSSALPVFVYFYNLCCVRECDY